MSEAGPLSAWLNEVYSYWAEYARDKDIKLVDEIDQNLPTIKWMKTDYQAVGNLLSNAIKYSPNGRPSPFEQFRPMTRFKFNDRSRLRH
jgi:signal transduction histidine kinase